MILSDGCILNSLQEEEDPDYKIEIEPFNPENIQPSGYDLTLSNEFLRWKYPFIMYNDVGRKLEDDTVKETSQWLTLAPGEFVLGSTRERVKLPGMFCAQVHGRSSIGRLGVAVHITAGYIDPGFDGQITLEIVNHSQNTVVISAGERVAQLVFMEMCSPPRKLYSGRYQHQRGPVASRLWEKK